MLRKLLYFSELGSVLLLTLHSAVNKPSNSRLNCFDIFLIYIVKAGVVWNCQNHIMCDTNTGEEKMSYSMSVQVKSLQC